MSRTAPGLAVLRFPAQLLDDDRGGGDGSLGCHPGHAGVFQPESAAAGLAQMLARSAGTPLDGVCRVPPAGQARCSPSSRKARSCAGQDQCQGRAERVRVSFDAVRVNSLARSLTWLPFPAAGELTRECLTVKKE